MYEAESQMTPGEARKDDGLSYGVYRAARERFLARLRADSETRRLEALWRTTGSHASGATNK